MVGQYMRVPHAVYGRSARTALQLEQVVELGRHRQESQLLVGPAQAHRQPALRRLPLDQHQGTEARAVDLTRAREVDDQAPGTLLQLCQQLGGRTTERARVRSTAR